MPKASGIQAQERFVQLLLTIVDDEQAVDVPTRYATLIRLMHCALPHETKCNIQDHHDLQRAALILAHYLPMSTLAIDLGQALSKDEPRTARIPELMRAWLEAYLETTGWETPSEPAVAPSFSGQYGPEHVEVLSAHTEGASLPTAGCFIPLHTESTRFG